MEEFLALAKTVGAAGAGALMAATILWKRLVREMDGKDETIKALREELREARAEAKEARMVHLAELLRVSRKLEEKSESNSPR